MDKILVIDDEPGILELCKKILTREKYKVFTATSGQEALSMIPLEMFDLVLTDLNLADINGIQLVKSIKSSYPHTEVMVITGQATVETAIESMKSGAYDYIPKPFNVQELVSAVQKALEYNRLRRQENIFGEIIYLYKFSQEITKSTTEKDMVNSILERAVKVLNADSGSIFVFNLSEEKLSPLAVYGKKIDENVNLGEGIIGWVAEQKQALLLQDGLDNISQFKELPKRHDIVSSMVAPLMDQEGLFGVICLNRLVKQTNYQFSPHDLESLQTFALHATLMVSALRHYQALKELDKLKSEFVANVSHELRTPLMAISGATELLKTYIPETGINPATWNPPSPDGGGMRSHSSREGDKIKEPSAPAGGVATKISNIMELMHRNTKRMSYLVNDLLDFSRLETNQAKLDLHKFSLVKLIDESIEDYNYEAKGKEITLNSLNVDKVEDIMMAADREKIRQIICNLLGNAMKFTPNKGRVNLEYKLENKDSVLISVIDSGIGIPEEKQQFIFDKFYQVDGSISRTYGGFGLGLAIVRSSVIAHNGKIWVESKPGQGAKFNVLLPLITV